MKREASWGSPKIYQDRREKDSLRQEIEEELEEYEHATVQLERRAKSEEETHGQGVALH